MSSSAGRGRATWGCACHRATRLLGGAGYTTFDGWPPEGAEHAGVASAYAHVTAPLRRLVDRYALEVCVSLVAGIDPPDWVRTAMPRLPEEMASSPACQRRRACGPRPRRGDAVRVARRSAVRRRRGRYRQGRRRRHRPGGVTGRGPRARRRAAAAARRAGDLRLVEADPRTARSASSCPTTLNSLDLEHRWSACAAHSPPDAAFDPSRKHRSPRSSVITALVSGVPWASRRTSRPGGRVRGNPSEESPGSTGHGGGQHPPGATRGPVPQKTDRRCGPPCR